MRGGPVSRILSTPDRDPGLDDHSSANRVTTAVKLPTRASRALASLRAVSPSLAAAGPAPARGPYLALLRVGLAVPVLLPVPRWAFTPPFHLYHADPKANLRSWRGSLFSVALSLGLPPPGVTRHPCQLESGLSSDVAARGHPALRAVSDYAWAGVPSTGKRCARSAASARSASSRGPVAQGRKRRRNAVSRV